MAATGAYDVRTGEATPLLGDELRDTFTSLLKWDREIGEGARQLPYLAHPPGPPVQDLAHRVCGKKRARTSQHCVP